MNLPTQDIITFWFGTLTPIETNPMWFDQSPDEYITSTYKYLVDCITNENIKLYLENNPTIHDKIALLLIGDQFTRNIYRHNIQRTKNDHWVLPLALDNIPFSSIMPTSDFVISKRDFFPGHPDFVNYVPPPPVEEVPGAAGAAIDEEKAPGEEGRRRRNSKYRKRTRKHRKHSTRKHRNSK